MVVKETLPAKREAQTKLYTSYAWSVPPALEAALGPRTLTCSSAFTAAKLSPYTTI